VLLTFILCSRGHATEAFFEEFRTLTHPIVTHDDVNLTGSL
jgi:hypothetical protein